MDKSTSTILSIIALIFLAVFIFTAGGLLTILSINALFGTAIVINFWNWAAATYWTAATWLTAVCCIRTGSL